MRCKARLTSFRPDLQARLAVNAYMKALDRNLAPETKASQLVRRGMHWAVHSAMLTATLVRVQQVRLAACVTSTQ